MSERLEDIHVGDEIVTPGRTITEGDVMAFAGLTGDFASIHVDEVYASNSIHGRRIAHGLLGLSVAQGLVWRATSGTGSRLASLGWDEWRFLRPIHLGDTVHVRCRVRSARPSGKDPSRGVVVEELELVNQHGEVVQSGTHTTLVAAGDGES